MCIQNNENKDTCTKCGGRCCKSLGGFFHPNDIGVDNITKDDLINFIKRGDVSIDWLEGDDDNLYFLRMRNQRANIIDPSWGGVCCHWTPNGCNIPFEKRPHGCKRLIPNPSGNCIEGCYDKYECGHDWIPYNDILQEIEDDIINRTNPELSMLYRQIRITNNSTYGMSCACVDSSPDGTHIKDLVTRTFSDTNKDNIEKLFERCQDAMYKVKTDQSNTSNENK